MRRAEPLLPNLFEPPSPGSTSHWGLPYPCANKHHRHSLMPKLVTAGAMLKCSFGAAPSALVVTPENKMLAGAPAANIMDHVPIKNIVSFGMCSTQSNPAVAAATAAASGVPTPAPCVPVTSAPWDPGSPSMQIGNQPALNDSSTCKCSYGGVITITSPGQQTMEIE